MQYFNSWKRLNGTFLITVALCVVFVFAWAGCDDKSADVKKPAPVGSLVSNTGCKVTVAEAFVPLDSVQDDSGPSIKGPVLGISTGLISNLTKIVQDLISFLSGE
jgi:hypothetical protein